MTAEHDHLENDIERERNKLAESLSDLTEQFSPERMIDSVGETLRTQSSDMAQTLMRGARDNPVAVGLVGAGLAWLLIGGSNRDGASGSADYDRSPQPTARGFNRDTDPAGFTDRVEAAERGGSAGGGYGQAGASSRMSQARDRVRDTAAQMRERVYEGTGHLSDIARARVVDARRRAIAAQERVEYHAGRAKVAGQRMLDDNPLLIGVGLAAVGAAAGYALPRTEMENRAFGEQRDALVAEADRVLHEEMERARKMGRAALDEATDIAHETVEAVPDGDEALEQAEGKLRSAGERIVGRARKAGDLETEDSGKTDDEADRSKTAT